MNKPGLDLIKQFEGCKLTTYKDIVGVVTIGYGHTGSDVHLGQVITQEQADELLEKDVQSVEESILKLVKVNLTENQLGALISFTYNLGLQRLKNSTLLKLINQNKLLAAANQFTKWDLAGGEVVPGLLRRRKAERDLFLKA